MLFGFLRKKVKKAPLSVKVFSAHGPFIQASVNHGEFIGRFSMSPDGNWGVGWETGAIYNGINSGGYFVIYDIAGGVKTCQRDATRLGELRIANNGTVALEDRGRVSELEGTFEVIDPEGSILFKKELDANIIGSWISPDGQYAICQTANNPKGTYGNCLIAFDVRSGEELFNVTPRYWGTSYEMPEDGSTFLISHTNAGALRYSRDGSESSA